MVEVVKCSRCGKMMAQKPIYAREERGGHYCNSCYLEILFEDGEITEEELEGARKRYLAGKDREKKKEEKYRGREYREKDRKIERTEKRDKRKTRHGRKE